MNEKIVAFPRRAETAADVHWNGIHNASRNLVQLATMVNSALDPGNGRDVCKTLAVELVRLGADIMRHNYEVSTYGYLPKHDDMIKQQAQVCLNLLADDVWASVLHPDFLTEFNRLALAIQAASRSRQEARAKREEATPAQNRKLG